MLQAKKKGLQSNLQRKKCFYNLRALYVGKNEVINP